jgi:peptidoglycan DL-endopeptidase CwlO
VNKSSLRRKWTALAVVGGLLFSAAASGTAWAQRDRASIEDELETSDADLNATIEEYNKLAGELGDTEQMIRETEKNLEEVGEELDTLRERLADFITETYVDQGVGDFAIMLDAGSPEAFVERFDRLNSANLYDFDLMQELKTTTQEYSEQLDLLDDLRTDLEAQSTEVESLIDEIETRMSGLEDEWRTVAGPAVTNYDLPFITGDRATVVFYALEQVGKQYVWGTSGPNTYDCSGLILDAYRQIGITLPHNAAAQRSTTVQISRDELQPGDLIFYNQLGHVGMYIGNGYLVHAPNSRSQVKVVPVDHGNVWLGASTVLG